MVTIKFLEKEGNDKYAIDPSSQILGRRYDNNSEYVQVVFPEGEVDSKCIMIVKDVQNNGIDLIEFTNNETKGITTNISQFDKVNIGFVFTKENYAKYSSYKTFYFEPSLYPDNFEPKEPEIRANLIELAEKGFANIRQDEQNPNTIEFLNVDGKLIETITLNFDGIKLTETDPTVPSYVKNISQADISKWNSKIDNSADNLLNYYLKKDTYSKEEIKQLIDSINSLKKEIVSSLPTSNIDDNTIYLVPKSGGNGNDYYDEYLYINNAFEFIGSTQMDLTGYIKDTDYATTSKAGVIKSDYNYGIYVDSNGLASVYKATNNEIDDKKQQFRPIVPANLDYAIKASLTDNNEEWSDTDKANARRLIGASKINTYIGYGINVNDDGFLTISKATDSEIASKTNEYKSIVPSNLDYAIVQGLINNANTLTDEQKTTINNWVGSMKRPDKDSGGYMILPAINHLGEQTTVRISYSPLQYALVPYQSGGTIKASTPTDSLHCTNKGYVDNLPDNLELTAEQKTKWMNMIGAMQKPDETFDSKAIMQYDPSTNTINKVSTYQSIPNINAGYIPISKSGGRITTQTPTEDLDCANKAYVDKKTSDVKNDIAIASSNTKYAISTTPTEISALNEYISKVTNSTVRMRGCAYGNGIYVIVGTSGALQYSTDNAETWSIIPAFTANVIVSVAYGGGTFICVDSEGGIFKSRDCINWEQLYSLITDIINAIVYVNGKFALVGANGLIAFSNDATNFNVVASGVTNELTSITRGLDKYVAVSTSGDILVSINGVDWENKSVDTTHYRTATFGKNIFVIGGQGGKIKYSTDSINWIDATNDSTSSVNYIRDIKYANGKFYAVMYISTGEGEIWTSLDGAVWTKTQTTSARLWCLGYGNDIFFASGDNGAIWVLNQNINWVDAQPTINGEQYIWSKEIYYLTDGSILEGEVEVYPELTNLESKIPTIITLTQDEYDALTPDENTLYLIKEE